MDAELSTEQIDELGVDLTTLKSSLEALLASTESDAKPVSLKNKTGRLTRMDEMHNQSILRANRTVTMNRLREVNIAIGRLEAETYGYCISCDESIAYNRLKAYPEASMCLACKVAKE